MIECDAAVVGAGPAGLATACALAAAGRRVVVVERTAGTRRKLCGEFLSGDGWRVLEELGVAAGLLAEGCPPVDGVLVSTRSGRSWQSAVEGLGRGCSRELLAGALDRRCRQLGAQVLRGYRADLRPGDPTVRARGPSGAVDLRPRVVVVAGGQAAAARRCRAVGRPSGRSGSWIAFSVRGRPRSAAARVELHALRAGYAGLCPIEGGRVNLCAMVVSAARQGLDPSDWPSQIISDNQLLRRWLSDANVDWDGMVTTAGMRFGHRPAAGSWPEAEEAILEVGDAAAAPAPLLGQGLAAALRGGRMLAEWVEAHLAGAVSRAGLQEGYPRAWRAQFARRFLAGDLLQRLLLSPSGGELAVACLSRLPRIGRRLVLATRGPLGAPT